MSSHTGGLDRVGAHFGPLSAWRDDQRWGCIEPRGCLPEPSDGRKALDAATAPELERWAERVLTAATLAEVLRD